MFDGSRKGVPVLTVLGALNDDYEGGELVMWNDTQIELTAGKIMIFPSNFLYPHEVKIVKEGIRYSFVSWVW
jgi:predicted 2-oxoglutarate/Fe(II)-dependent dioxygenase YbiX